MSQNSTEYYGADTILCKIKLGSQTQRGIIDIYMYILSKFYRERYELVKRSLQKPVGIQHHSSLTNIMNGFKQTVDPGSSNQAWVCF